MKTLAMSVEYDGTLYGGWQLQQNVPTVQGVLEKALSIITGEQITIHGSGRTDAGVHAYEQVAHAVVPDSFSIPNDKLCVAINTRLPHDVRINKASLLETPFHARFDAIEREYLYKISTQRSVFNRMYVWTPRYPLNGDILQLAAETFIGEHDFTTYSKHNPTTASYICKVKKCFWTWHEDIQEWHLTIAANRFVYGMVRCLTGAMTDAARGVLSLAQLAEALEAKDRTLASWLAPPQGLYLHKVLYKQNPFTV
jgi:tRNA pseudouridine38-40 synthase